MPQRFILGLNTLSCKDPKHSWEIRRWTINWEILWLVFLGKLIHAQSNSVSDAMISGKMSHVNKCLLLIIKCCPFFSWGEHNDDRFSVSLEGSVWPVAVRRGRHIPRQESDGLSKHTPFLREPPWWLSSQSNSANRIWRSPLTTGLSLSTWWACHVTQVVV
jgi:hypothetical protein